MARTTPLSAVAMWHRNQLRPPRYPAAAQTLRLVTRDSVEIHAVRLAGPAGCGVTVVLAHGFANWHRHARIHAFATALASHANVIVFDFRGHGLSQGVTSVGAYEWLDIAAVVAEVPADDALVLIGTSMGAGAAVTYAGLAGERGLRRADAVVAVSGPAWWSYRGYGDGVRGIVSTAMAPFTRLALRFVLHVRTTRPPADGWIDPVSVGARSRRHPCTSCTTKPTGTSGSNRWRPWLRRAMQRCGGARAATPRICSTRVYMRRSSRRSSRRERAREITRHADELRGGVPRRPGAHATMEG